MLLFQLMTPSPAILIDPKFYKQFRCLSLKDEIGIEMCKWYCHFFGNKEGCVKVGYGGTKREHNGLQSTQIKIYVLS